MAHFALLMRWQRSERISLDGRFIISGCVGIGFVECCFFANFRRATGVQGARPLARWRKDPTDLPNDRDGPAGSAACASRKQLDEEAKWNLLPAG